MRREIWWSAGVFTMLWLAWASIVTLASATPLGRVLSVLPRVPGFFNGRPVEWAIPAGALTLLLVGVAYALLVRLLARANDPSFAVGWLAAILASGVVGVALDLPSALMVAESAGLRGLLIEFYSTQQATFWAVFAGWVPALIVSRRRDANVPQPSFRTTGTLLGIAMVLVILLVTVSTGGTNAMNAQINAANAAEQEAQQQAVGSLPDPEAPGDPVAVRAATTDPAPDNACTAENSMLLLGADDAATGHRGQMIELMNFSEMSCFVEGYPDIAFGDQNEHALAVTIEHGRSFMAEDAGPVLVEVPAQGTVTATIGWDANSTHGALVMHTLHAAIRAGDERGSWPLVLDIVEGSTVAVTAWHTPASSTP